MSKETLALELANKMQVSGISSHGVFVDLPTGNKGMIRCEILDFGIPTGNPKPGKIIDASYVVGTPEMKMIQSGIEK